MVHQADVVIIGGGVSGLLAAISAARLGDHVIILEKLDRPGKKLLASGNGRCNLINLNPLVYYGETGFANAVLGDDPVGLLTDFWKEIGLFLRYDSSGRGYPCTFHSGSVLDALLAELNRLDVQVRTRCAVQDFGRSREGYETVCVNGDRFLSGRLILATGGAAQPKLGGNTDAWKWLEKTGHTMIPAFPSLTSVLTDRRSVSGLSGIRIRCRVTLFTDGKSVHSENGELLFTDRGISGICVMQCSRFVIGGRSEFVLDLFPDLFSGSRTLLQELIRRRNRMPDGSPADLLNGLCVPRISFAVCKQAGIPLRGEKNRDLTDSDLRHIAESASSYRIQAIGTEGFDKAQVMAGGLNCGEINPENLESMLSPGLHVTGELLNVDGDCGGYNMMFACMSGIKAGRNCRRKGNS